jgi:hypothetical protein
VTTSRFASQVADIQYWPVFDSLHDDQSLPLPQHRFF